MGRYAESLPHLRAFAEAEGHDRSAIALEVLVETLSRLDDFDGAYETWRELIRRSSVSDDRALELALTIDQLRK
jgi:hypothetical protein